MLVLNETVGDVIFLLKTNQSQNKINMMYEVVELSLVLQYIASYMIGCNYFVL